MTRLAAWEILRARSGPPLRAVDRVAAERGLDARDRGLLRRLVGTVVRRRGTLRAMVRVFARGAPNPDLVAHLQVGLAQSYFLDRVPDHAAVSETVRATCDSLGLSKGRYVNGVLRTAIRARRAGSCGDPRRDLVGRDLHVTEPIFRDPAVHPHLWEEDALSIPAPLMKRWTKHFGSEAARELATYFLSEPPLSLRVVGTEREGPLAELVELGCEPRPGAHPSVILCPATSAEAAIASEAFRGGRLSVQGETALRAAESVGAQPGERVLELCAAPGGKTAVLAGAGAHVTACDVDAGRGAELAAALERLGLADRVAFVCSDGTAAVPDGLFDAVLIDAPCSNTAVLGARPAARWRFGPRNQRSLRELQARLLREGAGRVRPGGRVVWSTCSLEPDENGQVVRAFLAERSDFELEEEALSLPDTDPDAFPDGTGPVDGGFRARLRRST